MAAKTRPYIVTDNTDPKKPVQRLVEATSQDAAKKHVTMPYMSKFSAVSASASDVARLMGAGTKLELASEDPAQ